MRLPGRKSVLYAATFVVLLLIFAFLLLNYTRRVEGVSMLPTLEEGDLVVIQPVPISDVHLGDIIVYGPPCSADGQAVIHRVVETALGGGFNTQGDDRATNPHIDQYEHQIAVSAIIQACLIGKVVFVVPYVERLASLPYRLNYILAALVFMAIIISEIVGRRTPQDEGHERRPQTQSMVAREGHLAAESIFLHDD